MILKRISKFLSRNIIYNTEKPKSSILNIVAVVYLILLIYPFPLFSFTYSNSNFQFYSTKTINMDELENVIGIVDSLLSDSSIYTNDSPNRIFICNNKYLYAVFSPLGFKLSFGVNHPISHYVFLPSADIENDKINNFSEVNSSRRLSSVLAHEIMHTYIAKYLGEIRNIFAKKWKKEGYCEYIANDSSFDITEGLELIKSERNEDSHSFKYFKYRLYLIYLLDINKLNLDTLFSTKFDMNKLDEEIHKKISVLEKLNY